MATARHGQRLCPWNTAVLFQIRNKETSNDGKGCLSVNSKPSDLIQLSTAPWSFLQQYRADAESSLPERQRLERAGPEGFTVSLLILN